MLNILNREVQRNIFTVERPEILISFLNNCFFNEEEKVISVVDTNDIAHPFFHLQSCFQDTIMCKVKTSKENYWIIEIDIVKIHNGKNTSFIKLVDKYFSAFVNNEHSYAYKCPLLYIGIFDFNFGGLTSTYHFPRTSKNHEILLNLINLKTWKKPEKDELSVFDEWIYIFQNSERIDKIPNFISDETLLEVSNFLNISNWNDEDLKYYYRNKNQWKERNERVISMYRDIESPLINEYLTKSAEDVELSIIPLLNQIKPNQIIIDIEFLNDNEVKKMAFNIFRKWIKQTISKYAEFEIVIKDERKIIQDFKSSLESALKSLIRTNKFYIDFQDGWDVGYVLGYMTGSLSENWHNEFMVKQTNDFKILTALQVLRDYLRFDDVRKIQLKDMYEKFIEENTNLAELDKTIVRNDFIYKGEKIEARQIGKDDAMVIALENMINKQIINTLQNKDFKAIKFNIDEIFPQDMVEKLIERNKSASNKSNIC